MLPNLPDLSELLVPSALGVSLTCFCYFIYRNGKTMNDFLLALFPHAAHTLDEALASHAATLLYRHYSPRPTREVQADFMQWLNGVDKPAALADILGLEIYLQPTNDPAFCQFAVTCYLGAEGDRMISLQGRSQHYPLSKLQAELQKELRQYGEATVILH